MRFVIIFIILYSFWILLSGKFDILHLIIGIICCVLVAYTTYDLWFTDTKDLKIIFKRVIRFILYLPWLVWQIMLANLHVAYLVLHPKMPIEPEIIKFKTKLKKDIALVTFGNSITLTPGTITIDIIDGECYIHTLSKKSKENLLSGKMEEKVAEIYDEKIKNEK